MPWLRMAEGIYVRSNGSRELDKLPIGVYRLGASMELGLFLEELESKFTFHHKLYNVQDEFIKRVVKTFQVTKSNLGILLHGTKGTGKTVAAKQICNELQLPVIIVPALYEGLPSYINGLTQSCVIFIDEYEKIYADYANEKSPNLLSVMDGVLNNTNPMVFLLTTNKLMVSEYLLNRPGRIRYKLGFEDLTLPVITQIVNDSLQRKHLKKEVIQFCANLQHITIDIVLAVVTEVNIHNEVPDNFRKIFNVQVRSEEYDIYEVIKDKDVLIRSGGYIYPGIGYNASDPESAVGKYFELNSTYFGLITKVLEDGTFEVKKDVNSNARYWKDKQKTKILRIRRYTGIHPNFREINQDTTLGVEALLRQIAA